MKKILKRCAVALLALCMMFSLAACGQSTSDGETPGGASAGGNTAEVAGEYYLDLTELGMKLTVFLRLDDTGNFLFSNTLDFEVNKSAGTFQKSDEAYIMVFTSVNGEEISISDGKTASFVVTEDGSLDFSVGDAVPYGTATIDTVSAEDSSIILLAHAVTDDYEAPSSESSFQMGTYTTEPVEKDGVYYTHMITFYEDNTYLHFVNYEKDGQIMYDSETGTYGISTTQLALNLGEGDHASRVECEVVDASNLKVSVLKTPDAAERTTLDFAKADTIMELASYTGTGTVTGTTDTFEATLTIYEDGSYETVAEGFTESGVIAMDSAAGTFKQYPDHPETGVRGLSQVATVPSGTMDSGKIVDLRVRTSDNLTRYACTLQ